MMKLNFTVLVVLILFASGCKKDSTDFAYETSDNGLKYYFIEKNTSGKSGEINDIYTFNATFYTANDSIYLQKEIRFQRAYVGYKGDFQEGLEMLNVGDSAVFQLSADTFYGSIGQNLPAFIKSGEKLTLKAGVISILDPVSFKMSMYEKEIDKINSFVKRKNWHVTLDTNSGIRYEVTKPNPEATRIEIGDTVDLTSLYWYTIEEKIITRGKDNDNWTIVVGDPKLQTKGLSTALSFVRNNESARIILPYDQAFGENGNYMVAAFTTICIELKVADVRKKTTEE